MTIQDALKVLNISGDDITKDQIKKAYRTACKTYHPDTNPAGEQMMKMVNEAYETLENYEGTIKSENGGKDYGQVINEALNAIINLEGIIIEICGSWVWVSGNTKVNKETIKAAGFFWAPKKSMWYFRPESKKAYHKNTWSMDKIRETYGSENVETHTLRKLA